MKDSWSYTVSKRIGDLIQANYIVRKINKKNRLQFMGLRLKASDNIPKEQLAELIENEAMSLQEVLRAPYNGWVKPWCVRATSGHSNEESLLVKLDPSYIAFQPSLELCLAIGGAFHTTSTLALKSIATHGLVPGQGSSRLCTHFGCFAPFDPRNRTTRNVHISVNSEIGTKLDTKKMPLLDTVAP